MMMQGVPVRCLYFDVSKDLAFHLNTFRMLTEQRKVPELAIHAFFKNLEPPQVRTISSDRATHHASPTEHRNVDLLY